MRALPQSFTILAGVLATQPAAAADLKPAAPEYVRACPGLGAGFVKLPGSETCVSLSGDILAEARFDMAHHDLYIETARIAGNPMAFYDRIRIGRNIDRYTPRLDARLNVLTATRIGEENLITFLSLRSGQQQTAANARDAGQFNADIYPDLAWIKYAGLTAGRAPSFFNFSPGYTFSGGYASQRNLNLLGYTYDIGKIASVTASLEDGHERRVTDGVWSSNSGQRRPDIVVQGRFTPKDGLVHAAFASHEIRDAIGGQSRNAYAFNTGMEIRKKWSDIFGPTAGNTYGRLMVSGAWTNGALDYLGIPKFGTDYASDVDGRIRATRGRSTVVSYEHLWTPTLKTTVGWSTYDLKSRLTNFSYRVRGSVAQIGVEYMPVSGLMFGAEANYFRDKIRGVYFGVPATTDRVEIVTASVYARRRF